MKIQIKKSSINHAIIILISAYLLNVGYFANIMNIQRLATWALTISYLLLNINLIINYSNFKNTKIQKIFITMILWALFIIGAPLIHRTGDYSYFNTLITMLGTFLNLMVIMVFSIKISNLEKTQKPSYIFMDLIMYSMALYVAFTILCISFPFVKSFILNEIYIPSDNYRLLGIEKYGTRIGWAGFSGYSVSIKCTIANMFALLMILDSIFSNKKVMLRYYIIYILTLFGEFCYSRTGLLVSIIILSLSLLYAFRLKNVFSLTWTIIIAIIIVFMWPIIQFSATSNSQIAWIFEPILNLMSDEGFSTTSSTHIFRDMIFQLDWNTLLLGDGFYTGDAGYYMHTDLGFMRLILYFGVPGMLLTYCIVLECLGIIRNSLNYPFNNYYALLLLLLFLVFEFKGESILFILPMFIVLSLIGVSKETLNSIDRQNVIAD